MPAPFSGFSWLVEFDELARARRVIFSSHTV